MDWLCLIMSIVTIMSNVRKFMTVWILLYIWSKLHVVNLKSYHYRQNLIRSNTKFLMNRKIYILLFYKRD